MKKLVLVTALSLVLSACGSGGGGGSSASNPNKEATHSPHLKVKLSQILHLKIK